MKYILKPILYTMKYIFILIVWCLLTVMLIIERFFKLLGLLIAFLWDFKYKEIDYSPLHEYWLFNFYYDNLKDFYLLRYSRQHPKQFYN